MTEEQYADLMLQLQEQNDLLRDQLQTMQKIDVVNYSLYGISEYLIYICVTVALIAAMAMFLVGRATVRRG